MTDIASKRESIARRLKIAREFSGLSQGQVAKLIGLNRPSISEAEAGRRKVSSEELVEFSNIYSVDIGWITGMDNKKGNEYGGKLELAARELSKLKKDDLEKVLNLLTALKQE